MTLEKFLVVTKDEGEVYASMWTAKEILDYLGMTDCFEYDEIHVYDVREIGKVEELFLHGTWHDADKPLYMKVTRHDGTIVFDGFGTDH